MIVLDYLAELVTGETFERWEVLLVAAVSFFVGFLVLRIISRLIVRHFARGLRDQGRELLRKTLLYTGTAILFTTILNAAGVRIAGLLGAAGVLGIAIGIAGQTSLSNIISGLFLLSERYFEIGDVVRVGDKTGFVYSIDLLSIKIKTFDNVLLRIPNQNLIEQTITNVTRFPIRRLDILVTVPLHQSLSASISALREAGEQSLVVLEEPEPVVIVQEQTNHGWSILLGVWFERENFVSARNSVAKSIQDVFRAKRLKLQTATIEVVN